MQARALSVTCVVSSKWKERSAVFRTSTPSASQGAKYLPPEATNLYDLLPHFSKQAMQFRNASYRSSAVNKMQRPRCTCSLLWRSLPARQYTEEFKLPAWAQPNLEKQR